VLQGSWFVLCLGTSYQFRLSTQQGGSGMYQDMKEKAKMKGLTKCAWQGGSGMHQETETKVKMMGLILRKRSLLGIRNVSWRHAASSVLMCAEIVLGTTDVAPTHVGNIDKWPSHEGLAEPPGNTCLRTRLYEIPEANEHQHLCDFANRVSLHCCSSYCLRKNQGALVMTNIPPLNAVCTTGRRIQLWQREAMESWFELNLALNTTEA